ncbi:MAG: FtsB family cell division protein [Eubacteriales bacterium]
MTYNLKRSKGGINAEKTYEFNINGPLPKTGAGRIAAGQKGQAKHRNTASVSLQQRKNEAARRAFVLRKQELARAASIAKRKADREESEQRIRTIRSDIHVPLPTAIIFMSVICTVLFMYIIFNMVQISEQGREINAMKSELSALDAEKKDYEKELEAKNDLRYIEEYALNELGMVKSDQLARQYVNIESEDKIEVMAEISSGTVYQDGLSALVKSAGTKLSELWEYIS